MSVTPPAKRIRRANSARIPRIAVQLAVGADGIPSALLLRRWARAAVRGSAEVVLRVVGTAEARRLNREFRRRDYATDVLTFVYARPTKARRVRSSPARRVRSTPARRMRPALVGDIVLCHPVLARAARERGITLAAHYAHLVVHGMLHLRGYAHRAKSDAVRMQRAEARLLAKIGFRDPYAVESPQQVREGRPRLR